MTKLNIIAACVVVAGGLFSSTAFAGQYHDNFERWVDIVNDSDLAIYQVQISNIDVPNWGRDLLGNEVIMGEDVMRLEPHNPNGYCRFDVRVTYEDGSQVDVYDVNLCEAVAIEVDDNGYSDVYFA